MNTKLAIDKELRNIPDGVVRFKESQIKMIQVEYGYDRNTAAKIYEYQQFKGNQVLFNTAVGLFAAYKVGPFQKEAAATYPLFRKAWMRLPIAGAAFGGAFWIASLLQQKWFHKWISQTYYKPETRLGIGPNTYLNNHDLISKFRIFEEGSVASADAATEVESYLDVYSSGPLTKAEMLNRFAEGKQVDANYAKNF